MGFKLVGKIVLGSPHLLSNFRRRFKAAFMSRFLVTTAWRTWPSWSTARHRWWVPPSIFTSISSGCHCQFEKDLSCWIRFRIMSEKDWCGSFAEATCTNQSDQRVSSDNAHQTATANPQPPIFVLAVVPIEPDVNCLQLPAQQTRRSRILLLKVTGRSCLSPPEEHLQRAGRDSHL